jgi:hypothetical protein
MFSSKSDERRIIPVLARKRGEDDEYEYGIYHADREYAEQVGDPMLTVVRAKSAAEALILAKNYSQVASAAIAVTDNVEVARKAESEFSFRTGTPVSEESMKDKRLMLRLTVRPLKKTTSY